MADVFDVAKYILNRIGKDISTFKLQKLVYYSQAWSLVWDEKPLFPNKIFAWANGPVCKDLYEQHRGYFNINEKTLIKGDASILTLPEKETIDTVIESYARFTGQELSNLTHTEMPWIKAREGLAIGERGEREISLDDMTDYYSGIYAEQRKSQSAN